MLIGGTRALETPDPRSYAREAMLIQTLAIANYRWKRVRRDRSPACDIFS
jgi:hypothetical protein